MLFAVTCCAGLNEETKTFKVLECRFARRLRQRSGGRGGAPRGEAHWYADYALEVWNILKEKGITG
jgi:hypothetical protein